RAGTPQRTLAWARVWLCPPSLAAECDRGLVFVTGDPNDAYSEAGRGVLLDERVRCCRIDPLHDGVHWHSGVPLLDMRQHHSARRITGIGLGLRRCPMVNPCREFGATDELCLGGQVDQGEIAGGKGVAMSLV